MSSFRHSYALVIGIDSYRNGIPQLKTAVSDAAEITRVLEAEHGYTVIQLLDQKATREQIQHELEVNLLRQIQSDDRVLFYFAGHGIALNGDDGPEGYLIPQDASFGNVSTYLSMSQVHQALLQFPCRHLLGVLDCCFAGAFRWSSIRKLVPVDLGTIHKERFDRFIQNPAWQVITSASYDQTASDGFDLKDDRGQKGWHSPFAAALITALQGKADAYPPAESGKPAGDGVITATELYLYLRERLEVETEARFLRQTPGIYPLKKHDKGEYIFLTPGHPLNLPPAPPLDASSNPYRGLESFDEADKALFFGRQALTQQLALFVQDHAITIVLGASGSGKSSLVKAGLVPHLREMENWFILPPFRPGEFPLKALNQVLESFNPPAIAPHESVASTTPLTPLKNLSQWFEQHSQAHLLLVVDQLEELITLCQDDQERHQFLELLAQLIALHSNQLHLVFTLRSDFEPQFRNTPLEKNWLNARFIVPPMTREELRQAIEEPASARVMYFDPHELVDQLIDEVANMPGALPLLSFALSELYLNYLKRQEAAKLRGETLDRAMTQADYEELGGVTRSLTHRADQEYEALVKKDSAYAQTIRHVMLRMVAVGDELARRRVLMSELVYPEPESQRVHKVIEQFLKTRLLVSGLDAETKPYVEPVHDALVRGWQQLLNWKKHEQEHLILQRQLTPAATDWQSQQSDKFLWNANPRLDLLHQVLSSSDNWFNRVEAEFVQQSLNLRRKNTLFRWGLAGAAFLALSSFTAILYFQLQQAELREKSARIETLLTTNPVNALVLAIQATGQNRSRLPGKLLISVESSLLKAVGNSHLRNQFEQQGQTIEMVAISPSGKTIVTVNNQGTSISVWSVQGKLLANLSQESDEVYESVAFSPDGSTIIGTSIMVPNTVKLWNLQGHVIPLQLQQASSIVTTLAYDSTGERLVTGAQDGMLRVWSKQGKPLTSIFGRQGDRITALAFSPDGTTIACGSENGQIQLWTPNGKFLGTFSNNHKSLITSITFSADSLKILTRDISKTTFLWSFQKKVWIGNLFEQASISSSLGFTNVVAFTPQGAISGHADGSIKLWRFDADLNRNFVAQLLPSHLVAVTGLSLSSNTKTIVSADESGQIKIWDFYSDNLVTQFLPASDPDRRISAALVSANGKRLAITKRWKNDVAISFREVKNSQIGQVIEGFKQPLHKSRIGYLGINLLNFSTNAQQIIVSSPSGIIRVWDINGVPTSVPIDGGLNHVAALSPNGQQIVTGGSQNSIRLWNLQGQMLDEQALKSSNATVKIVFSADGKKVVAGDIGEVCIWTVQPTVLTQSSCKAISNGRATAFSPDSRLIVIGDAVGNLYFWNLETNQEQSFRAHQESVTSIAFSPDGTKIVSSSEDGSIQLSTVQGALVGSLPGDQDESVSSVAFSPDGKTVVSTRRDGSVKAYQASWEGWLKVGCDRIQYHPLLNQPETITLDPELIQVAHQAEQVCQQRVWQYSKNFDQTPLSWLRDMLNPINAGWSR